MRRDLPQWVLTYCKQWGSQKRRIWNGGRWLSDVNGSPVYDVDGFAQSFMGRIREEGDGAGQGETKQHWAEVMWGNALEVQRVLSGMPFNPFNVGHLQYVWPAESGLSIPQKAKLLELTKADYWRELEIFEFWVFARLDAPSDCLHSRTHLQPVSKTPTVQPTYVGMAKVSSPDINLEALNRPTLRLKSLA